MSKKDVRDLLDAAAAQGFVLTRTSKGHWLIRDSTGRAVTTLSGSPSDTRALQNGLAHLRRAGLIWPPPKR